MKRLLTILILIFTLQTPSQADDIRDFQIEGISIGDSALDYFIQEQIQKNKRNYYKNKKFTPIEMDKFPFFKLYDAIDFQYKADDENYKIYGLSGIITYTYNVKNCYNKMDDIVAELSELLKNNAKKSNKKEYKHKIDPSGKSKYTSVNFTFNDGSMIRVVCYDYSEESGYGDHLNVGIKTKEFLDFLTKVDK